MKRTLISLLCILAANIALAQHDYQESEEQPEIAVNVALDEVTQRYTAPIVPSLKSAEKTCKFNITFENFPVDAKVAFEYAISIWEQQISSPVVINVKATWGSMPDNQLGNGAPSTCYRNFKGTPLANIFYPVALTEKLIGKEYNNTDQADIVCNFNSTKPWYFGTNGKTPATQYDLVTAVLHEIGHGLGIVGYLKNVDGLAQFSNTSNSPSIYDYYIFNKNNQRIADNSIFPSPSTELTKQLTSNALNFNYSIDSENIKAATIYAPTTWTNGISIYHLKSDAVSGNQPEIMNAYAYKGEAIHAISDNTLNVLSEIGWKKSGEIYAGVNTANDEEIMGNEVNVYPNPFSETLTFECNNLNNQIPVEIRISDLMGRIVFHKSDLEFQYSPTQKIDLSEIKSGIYLASITDSNNKTISKRIVKQ